MITIAFVIEGEHVKKIPIVLAVGLCLAATACSAKARSPLDGAPSGPAALQQLATLVVAPEDTDLRYSASDWGQFERAPEMPDKCTVRDRVLQQQGTHTTVKSPCRLSGRWTSPYDGQTAKSESGVEVDHVVGTAEANRSGVRSWSAEDRRRFANDDRFLIAVSRAGFRQRNGQDPAHWLPQRNRCAYAARYVQAKATYHLMVDQTEKTSLTTVLRGC